MLDSRDGSVAVLPGPAPREGDKFPSNKTYYEIPIAIQDRSFNADGSLFYPDSREFFDGIVRDYIPHGEFSPIWNPEFFGNTIMANGNTWPFQTVEQRRYRFRFLNGCQSRFLILDFQQIPGVEVWAIGNEGGFLSAPVNLTADNNNRLLMGLAERADLIVDFTSVPVGSYILRNVGPDEPFGGGDPLNLMSRATSMRPTRRQRDRSCSSGSCLLEPGSHHASTVAAPACANAATEQGPDATAGAHREGRRRLRRRRQRGRGPHRGTAGDCHRRRPHRWASLG